MTPIETAESIEQRVIRLLQSWRSETAYTSSSATTHWAYQELIRIGADALPYLFRDLESSKDGHLSKALTAITGAQPIDSSIRGQVGAVADGWLRWAREQGYQW
jgi:hypothetical protein